MGRHLEFNDPAFRGTTKTKKQNKPMIQNDPNQPRPGFPTNALPSVFWEISHHLLIQVDVSAWILVIPFERVRHG